MHRRIVILFFCCCYYFIGVTRAIDMDYYFSFLRNTITDCYSKQGLKNCEILCQKVPVLCHEGECYCHHSVADVIKQPKNLESLAPEHEVQIQIIPHSIPREIEEDVEDVPDVMLTNEALRPALRHHIAHFCPNLDVARKCIRKCMESGKPAFCGKDHRCYCGHRYGYHDSQNEQNALDTYKNFADMYAKYLGHSYQETQNSNDENTDSEEDDSDIQKLKNKVSKNKPK